jgi:6-phosphogluconolactonase (cycloisomerase 2 family)
MAYKIKSKGRPRATFKVRSVKGITPRGFKFHEIKGKIIVFKIKGKRK